MQRYFLFQLEWSDSPNHQGTYNVYLEFHEKTQRWTLAADHNPSGTRLSWKKGDGSEDPRVIAIELLKRSNERGALLFDCIAVEGELNITRRDFAFPKVRYIETKQPIDPPQTICKFCRFLKHPESVMAGWARLYNCNLGNWSDEEHTLVDGERQGMQFSCDEFKPKFKTKKVIYY
jgi:hypothetical protein